MKFLIKKFDLRKIEEGWLKNYFYTSAIANSFFWVAPTFMSVATFGAYKSSLLSSILEEVPRISGTVRLCGTKAYVSQSPWIQRIEEKILFGKEMERERYDRILEVCALKKDIEILSFGDQTIIGERGINLSGGQKQRIQIARALYQDSDIYLFDDPFSVVDAHTGSHIFKEVLLDILNTKTVIYITHQVEFLPAADLILVMKDGRITQVGQYNDILIPGLLVQMMAANSSIDKVIQKQEHLQNSKEDEIARPKGQLIQGEEREKGRVGFPVYWQYVTTAFGEALVPIILLAAVLFQILQICSNYWMAWATPESKDVRPLVTKSTMIGVYVAFTIGSGLCLLVRVTFLLTARYKTTTLLFNKMHYCIFRAPMSFFDAIPSGPILNRASTDQSQLDLQMAYQVDAVAFTLIQLLGIIGVMSQVAWQVFIIFFPVACVCIWYQKKRNSHHLLCTATELSRLEGLSKAPIFQHFSETISGSTIRSFDQQSRFQKTNMKLMDSFSRSKFQIAGAVWYSPYTPLVLRGLTCTFPGGKKTGIVGRTCSGKSTLIQTLFRIVELAAGRIVIDGIDISSIGLHDLRSKLSIFLRFQPCSKGLYRATWTRSKNTQMKKYGRWALDRCQLADEVRKKGKKLDSPVSENGENWSMGQRQLVCLGRVVLKKSKILILNEATASVDTATDNLIQQAIRQQFCNCTLITIVHRITSILDSYMVLLLSNGLIEEFDSPRRLLNKSSSFAQLVAEYTMRSNTNF
ncbi:multidrug resistance-associated protein 2, 6 (mrp2, 6), abc-transoprter, putative [Ricinus communis]|uniref:ABC-type xenobiotic transporter n=1 Tax=Ricinus communis TaxID=3988 RepID=B9T466_RICCO|nr:multidrug resistance-associated protein 2, 6 (mrp2, 6), abc-transoprter, putative [Ricinus communis]